METDLATIELQDQDEGLACVRPHRRGACHARGLGQAPRNGKWNLCNANRGSVVEEDSCKGAKGSGRFAERTETPSARSTSIVDDGGPKRHDWGGGCQDSRSEGPVESRYS